MIGFGVAAAAVMAFVIGIGMATREGPPPPPAAASPSAIAEGPTKTFAVSAADRDDKATDHMNQFLKGSVGLDAVLNDLKADNAAALTRLVETSPQVTTDLESGRRRMYRVYLLDFLDQDGDRVELFLDGISYGDIDLRNEGASVLLPVAAGTPLQVKMVATADGGGGVTVAFISSMGEARTSVMQLGEFEQWQVVVQ